MFIEPPNNVGVNSFDSNRFEHYKKLNFAQKQPVWQSFWTITL